MSTGKLSGVIQHLRRAMHLRDGLTDGQLLKDYISHRDEAALTVLVQRHGPMVWGVCHRVLGNYHDAEDAFQATFLVLVRRAASIASPELLANWLYGVAHQTALKARANAARRKARETQVTDMPEPAAVDHDLWNDLQPLLDQELSWLPEIHRAVIVLCDLQGKTRKEAARHLGLSEGTVGSRLARARATLAKRLSGRGVTLSGGALAAVLAQHVASAGAPGLVMSNAIKAASLYGAGQAAAGSVSLKVTALAEGVLKAMVISKVKTVVAIVLLFAFLGTGATILMRHTSAAPNTTSTAPEERVKSAQTEKQSMLEGSNAGDRKELVPGIAFRWCPAGKFKMGEGEDAVEVELSKGFWLGETEVTQRQWQKLMGTRPWTRGRMKGADGLQLEVKEGPDYPASYISYDDALSFCKKLTTQEQDAGRLPKTWKYLLPTEAQWEYACRAGTKTRFSFGDDESQLSQYAWFTADVNKVNWLESGYVVGLKKPNAWGLRDMCGNVREWCSDWYASKLSGGKDPVGPTTPPPPSAQPDPLGPITPPPPDGSSGKNRVVRGGSWIEPAVVCTSANRFYYNPRLGNGVQGFRIVAVPEALVKTPQKEEHGREAAVWGDTVGGWRMRVTTPSGTEYRARMPLPLSVEVENVSGASMPIELLAAYADPEVTANGKRLITRVPIDVTSWEGRRDQLPAGASLKWTVDFDRLRFATQPLKAGTALRVRFRLAMQGKTPDGKPDPRTQRLLFSNEVSLKLQDDHPALLSAEADLPPQWTRSMVLVYREHIPLLGYDALRIDGDGHAWLVSMGRGKTRPATRGPSRTEAVLDRERLDGLAKFLRDQKLWELAEMSQGKIPAPDEGEIRLSIGAGHGSLVGSVPSSAVRGQPKLRALQAEMAKVMALVNGPPPGLEFLRPYPEFHDFRFGQDEKTIRALARKHSLKLTGTAQAGFFVERKNGERLALSMRDGRCSGIQLLRRD